MKQRRIGVAAALGIDMITTILNGPQRKVFVRTFGEGDVSSDKAFRLTVACWGTGETLLVDRRDRDQVGT